MTDAAREFTLTLDGVEYDVVAEGDKITVNGRPFTVDVGDDGSILVDGIAYDVAIDADTAQVGNATHTVTTTGLSLDAGGPAAPGQPGSLPQGEPGDGAVVAIMPGKITRVLVEQGEQVEDGQAVCVLEAMKMENELRVDRDGVVEAVHVRPGEDVEKGQALVTLG